MDAISIWLIVLVLFPFILFCLRVLLMTWTSFLHSRKMKNRTNNTVIPDNPVVIYPTTPPVDDYSYDIYAYVIVVFVLVLFLSITKAIVRRRQKDARRSSRRQARTVQTRQAQVPSVSATVVTNSATTSDPPSTSQPEAHVKIDLPPTYDEVMKHYLEAKGVTATASRNDENATVDIPIEGTSQVNDSPPPGYSNV